MWNASLQPPNAAHIRQTGIRKKKNKVTRERFFTNQFFTLWLYIDLFHHISSYFHKDHKHINREHYIALSNTCNRDIGPQTLGRDSGPNPRTGWLKPWNDPWISSMIFCWMRAHKDSWPQHEDRELELSTIETYWNPCSQIAEIPSGELTVCNWKWPFIVDFPIKKWWFSIAMLVHQRVS